MKKLLPLLAFSVLLLVTVGSHDAFAGSIVVNQPPTLDPLSDIILNKNSPNQMIPLTGITPGPEAGQLVFVSASSDNVVVVANPVIVYPDPTPTQGTMILVVQPDAVGQATISVNIMDDGGTANGGVDTLVSSFKVTVVEQNSLVGGKMIPIEASSLILAGAQSSSWMIPVTLLILGIGMLVVFRKSDN